MVDGIVAMREDVPKADHLSPWDFGVFFSEGITHLSCFLAEDFKLAFDSGRKQLMSKVFRKSYAGDELLNTPARNEDIPEMGSIAFFRLHRSFCASSVLNVE